MPVELPIKIVFYDSATNEASRTYLCNFISWKIFKAISRLAIELDRKGWGNLLDEERNALASLVIEAFGRQFSYDDLMRGSNWSEMCTVVQEILNKLRRKDTEVGKEVGGSEAEHSADDPADDWMTDLDITLIKFFGWSLRDIDETDVDSLRSILSRFAGSTSKEPARKLKKCDQVGWL
ncbi:MAG: hypothetical protein A2136_05460 [Chloroflexi bacterium RBG_16_54_11]|nr:MAG: hypothetical protein A2136_05460 [Chloroflexi bacterium RBG_16_54_11]